MCATRPVFPKPLAPARPPTLPLQPPVILKDIERIRTLKRNGLRTNTDTAIEIGASLQRLKVRLRRGLWSRLLRNQLHYGSTTAKRFISLYRFAKANGPFVGHFKYLGPSKLTSLSGVAPDLLKRIASHPTHRLPAGGHKSLEDMNQNEFTSFLRGLNPATHCQAPQTLRLFRGALHAARQLTSHLSALSGRTLNDSDLLKSFLEAVLEVKRMLAGYPGEAALRRRYRRAVTG